MSFENINFEVSDQENEEGIQSKRYESVDGSEIDLSWEKFLPTEGKNIEIENDRAVIFLPGWGDR
ncbi:hypothetical protein H6761_02735 [Candidatus Nomurabacteria bacterium]|nr:hypothetical protein [Candidatus Nomurabacteria bacterium]